MRVLVAIVLVFAGCGLAPAPDPSGPGAETGIAPWTDLGPAQVCLGDQALGPPSAPPGGLCVAPDSVATACISSSDCRSREDCLCGKCTVTYCATASDCAAPRTCNFIQNRCDLPCSSSPQCGDAEECIGAVCRGRCADAADCQHGEVCDSNHVCVSASCSDASTCLGGERCEIQRTPRQALEPAPLLTGTSIVLYVDLAAPNLPDQRAIWRAVSADGIHFTIDPSQPVLDDARAPSAVSDGTTTYLYFESGDGVAIAVATSTDGITFGAPTTILTGPDTHTPTAVHLGTSVTLYYERGGAIALATGTVGSPLDDRGVVLTPQQAQVGDGTAGTAFWTPVTQLASPHAIVAGPDGGIHVWFAGFGQESSPATNHGQPDPIPPNFSIGFAAADPADPGSLAVWPYGPVADRVEGFLDHRDELGPAAIDAGSDRFFLYYVDATHDAAGTYTLGRLGVLGSGR